MLINLIGTYVDWVGTDLRLPVALAVILGVLLVRPTGLFGRAECEARLMRRRALGTRSVAADWRLAVLAALRRSRRTS